MKLIIIDFILFCLWVPCLILADNADERERKRTDKEG